jgi:hypothetical protein
VISANSEFILSLDPDDEILPHIAEDVLHYVLLHRVDIVEFHVTEVFRGRAKQFSFLSPPLGAIYGPPYPAAERTLRSRNSFVLVDTRAYVLVSTKLNDDRELVPEFLANADHFDLGSTTSGKVDDVVLPT